MPVLHVLDWLKKKTPKPLMLPNGVFSYSVVSGKGQHLTVMHRETSIRTSNLQLNHHTTFCFLKLNDLSVPVAI